MMGCKDGTASALASRAGRHELLVDEEGQVLQQLRRPDRAELRDWGPATALDALCPRVRAEAVPERSERRPADRARIRGRDALSSSSGRRALIWLALSPL